MTHSEPPPHRWKDSLLIKTMTFMEGLALRAMPRGVQRKRLLNHIDRVLQQIHANRCGEPRL